LKLRYELDSNPTLSASKSGLQRNSVGVYTEIRETCPYFAILARQTGLERTDCLPATDLNVAPFLCTAESQSGFDDLPQANAMRSQTDDVAKPA
jgi:hypothetical protein